MSLVNDMLRDLDQRREASPGGGSVPVTSTIAAESAANTRWGVLAVAGLAVAAAVGWVLLDTPGAPATSSHAPVATVVPAPAPAAPPLAVALPEIKLPQAAVPVQITAVHWLARDGGLQLTLDSSDLPAFSLRRIDSRELLLDLKGVTLAATLPALPQGAIQALELQPAGDAGLELRLLSNEPVNYRVHPLQQDGAHRLQVLIESRTSTRDEPQPAPALAANAPVVTAPTPAPSKPSPAATAAKRPAIAPAPLSKQPRLTLTQRDQQATRSALEQARKGRVGRAVEALRAMLEEEPGALESRTLLATLLLSQQQTADAQALIEEGLVRAPADTGLRKLKARLLMRQGVADQAAQLLREGAPEIAQDPEYHQLKAAAEQGAGRHGEASRTYHALLQRDATNPAWWVGLGISLEALQQTQQARQAYANVLRIPQVPAALSGYARTRLQQLGG